MSTKKPVHNPVQIVVLGVSDDRKARAARFDTKDEQLVRRLAAKQNFRTGIARGQAATLASKLPPGKVFENGLLVPLCRSELYLSLSESVMFDTNFISSGLISGHEATPSPEHAKAAETLWSNIKQGSTVLAWSHEPSEPGDGGNFAWSAAVVLGVAGDLLELRWRDWRDAKAFKVKRLHVALLRSELS